MSIFGKRKVQTPSYQRSSSEWRKAQRRARVVRSNVGTSKIANTATPTNLKIRRYILSVVIVLLLVWSGYIGSDIKVTGASPAVEKEVSSAANSYFRGLQNWWWFVSEKQLDQEVKQSSSYVSSTEISRNLFSRNVVIEIEQRTPSLRTRVDRRQFLVAQDGVLLEASEAKNKLPLVFDETGLPAPEPGDSYLPETLVSQINEINNSLKSDKDFKVKQFTLPLNTREVRAETVKGFYVKFSTADSIDSQISDLKTVRGKISRSTEYVDVRFSGKVFIK